MDTDERMISQKVVPTFEGASAIVADKIQQVEIYICIYKKEHSKAGQFVVSTML